MLRKRGAWLTILFIGEMLTATAMGSASSAPFVATIVDVTGIVICFCIAALLLRGTLL